MVRSETGPPPSLWLQGTMVKLDVNGGFLSENEVRDALEALSSADHLRLGLAAQRLCAGTGLTGADLLNEAVCRLLAGDRSCKRTLPIVVLLYGAMRSIAWSSRAGARADPIALGATGTDALVDLLQPGRTVETLLVDQADYKQRLAALERLFADDEEAFLVVMADADGTPATQVREQLGLTEAGFATVRKRIRRAINRAYPGGWNE